MNIVHPEKHKNRFSLFDFTTWERLNIPREVRSSSDKASGVGFMFNAWSERISHLNKWRSWTQQLSLPSLGKSAAQSQRCYQSNSTIAAAQMLTQQDDAFIMPLCVCVCELFSLLFNSLIY